MAKQIHLEINLFYWHHSHIEGQPIDLISLRILEIHIGEDTKGNLIGITQLPITGHLIFNLLFFIVFIVRPFWKRNNHGE